MENPTVDERSGFCKSNGVYYSKRKPVPLPPNQSVDVTTFISSRAHGGKIAFIDAATGRRTSFPELWRAVDSVAACLSDMGIRKGDVILLLSPNSVSFPVVCLAVMSLGAIITTTNTLNTPREIAKQIADSRPILAFTTRHLVTKIFDSSPDLPVVLMDGEDDVSRSPRIVSMVSNMMRTEPSERRVRDRVDQDDTATLLYSSGTTGASKGVVSSHRNLIALVQVILGQVGDEGGEHTFLCTVPMFHIFGLAGGIGHTCTGSTTVILSKFEIDDMLSAIERYGVTFLPLVPPILVTLLNGAEHIKARFNLNSLHSVLCGGAPLSKEVIEGFVEKFPGIMIKQGYSLTESNGFGASTNSVEESRVYGSAGLLSPNSEAKIVDPDTGEALPVKKAGELWLRAPGVMKGALFLIY